GARMLHAELEQAMIEEGDYDRPILVYCYRGNESKKKADYLAQRGFKRVYSLDNGFTGWPRSKPEEQVSLQG
ncbi:MAG TPA: rhodanese-like domain-containing protein, partial [Polyangiaceae bacterium]|nr:rhodanese-like domain-containing protein [Polyangiaceae bacterium]